MCGICGEMRFDKKAISLDDKTQLVDSIEFRGPDNIGVYNSPNNSVFLGQPKNQKFER